MEPTRHLRIALIGTRGVPARYGGFETAVEEVGQRLAARGHDVRVYCRAQGTDDGATYAGMRRIVLPAIHGRSVETLSHTALSVGHVALRAPVDVAFVFNAANAPLLPVLRMRGVPTAVHVDGLEWRRAKWGGSGRRYYRSAESLAVRWADALIADAAGIESYYRYEFGAATEVIAYGAPVLTDVSPTPVVGAGLVPGGFHLVVARFEPENNVELIVRGYRASTARMPLVVVGSAPYADDYTRRVHDAAEGDERIRFLGAVWDQDLLDSLYAHCASYLHGQSVGGTNPSLLRAMGAGAAVAAIDVVFTREVLGDDGCYFRSPEDVAERVAEVERDPDGSRERAARLQARAARTYRWDDVADGYEQLAGALVGGASRRGEASGRRRSPGWDDELAREAVAAR